jgi:sugar phosphate permease
VKHSTALRLALNPDENDKKPMRAIGTIAGLNAGFAYLAAMAGVWIYRHL